MKTLQGMITMYFIQQGINDIYHWNACHKLKDYDIPKKLLIVNVKIKYSNYRKTFETRLCRIP